MRVNTARAQKDAVTAKQYFGEHFSQSDYYSEGQRSVLQWFGKGVDRLGISPISEVAQEACNRLCDNLHPVTGETLTSRRRQKDRRVCYDFTVSAPKSVSILALVFRDLRLLKAHEESAAIAMAIGGSVTPFSVGASVAPGVLMENMARGSSDSEANPPAARRTIFEIRRRWLRCSCRVESGRASEKRNCRAFMSHLHDPGIHRKTRRCGSPRIGECGSRATPAYPYASGGRWVAGLPKTGFFLGPGTTSWPRGATTINGISVWPQPPAG